MQTVTDKNLGVALMLFGDDATIALLDDRIVVSGGAQTLIIADMNSNNALLHTGVTPPDDWEPGKYLFDGTTWSLK